MKKIIFVDDDARILDAFKRMLRKLSDEWQCRFATGADEAWEMVLADLPDAIVSDLNMPGKNGVDLLRYVRENTSSQFLPFILLTGNSEMKKRMECLDAGATDFLNKPCDFAELTARLRNALTLKAFQDEVRRQNEVLEQRVSERTSELEDSRREVIFRLAMAAELRDATTGYHIFRVGLLSKLLAAEIGFDQVFQEELFLASMLHDIGKLGISDSILLKPGKLTPDEYAAMKEHCKIGADALQCDLKTTFGLIAAEKGGHNRLLELSATIAFSHHERWDGSGYPNGLRGGDIPMTGRIVAVADVFDALCSVRPYKDLLPPELALDIIEEESGSHFDPSIVAALMKRREQAIEVITNHADSQLQQGPKAA